MKQDVYVVIGKFIPNEADVLNDLIGSLKQLGEINIFDMPTRDALDKVDCEGNVLTHHYACPENPLDRTKEIVRDIVLLGAKEAYLDYGVPTEYQSILKMIDKALCTYGIKVYRLNKCTPLRWVRNIVWDIQFWIKEFKLQAKEENELEQVEVGSGHGSMHGFTLYKKFEAEREERKRLHQLRKLY